MAWLTSLVVGCQKTCLAALAPINPFQMTLRAGLFRPSSELALWLSVPQLCLTFQHGHFLLLVPPNQAEQTISWFESQDIDA